MMNHDPKVNEDRQPGQGFLVDGKEDPQTLPQLEPGHSSDEVDITAETLEAKH